MLARRTVSVIILAVAISGCAAVKPHPSGDPPTARVAYLRSVADQRTASRQPHFLKQSKECHALKDSQSTWGWTSKGLAVVAGGMAAAGALPVAALLAGASAAGLGVFAGYRTADYVKSCTTGNASRNETPVSRERTRRASDKPPPLSFSGVLTIVAGMISAI